MAPKVFRVHADWDPEAEVWVATSDDVPGLATEAETIERLTEKLRTLIPELLEANLVPSDPRQEVVFELTSRPLGSRLATRFARVGLRNEEIAELRDQPARPADFEP